MGAGPLLPHVDPLVDAEVVAPLERLLADAALVGSPTCVGPLVANKVRGPGEAAVAAGAEDAVALGVVALVQDQEALAGEVLHAVAAGVHDFPG